MAYIGREPTNTGEFLLIDDISSNFDGETKSFTLKVGTSEVTPAAANTVISVDGVLQQPSSSYSISGSTITFTGAPDSGLSFYGVLAGQSQYISNNSITNDHISGTANISGSKINTNFGAQSFQLTNITASGDISASGTVFADNFQSAGGDSAGISFTDDFNLTGNFTASGDISGSAITTGSFGSLRISSPQTLTVDNTGTVSGSATSTGSFGRIIVAEMGNSDLTNVSSSISTRLTTEEGNVDALQTDSGSFSTRVTDLNLNLSGSGTLISGSVFSTGSFGRVIVAEMGNSDLTDVSASISTRITTNSGSFAAASSSYSSASGSLSTRVNLLEGSGSIFESSASFSTRVSDLVTDSGSFSTRVTTAEASGALFDGDGEVTFAGATITGTLTAQEVHTEFISASVTVSTGSNIFGDETGDVHQFTGSIETSGSIILDTLGGNVSGSIVSTGSFGAANVAGMTVSNLVDVSSSISTRVSDLVTDSGSFSTRVSDLVTDSGSFSTRVSDLVTDSGSFSTRVSDLNLSLSGSTALISGSSVSTGSFGGLYVGGGTHFPGGGISFGDGDSGIFESGDDSLRVRSGGNNIFLFNSTSMTGDATGAPRLLSAAGAAATPVYTFNDDPNTGMFRTAADSLGFSTNGVQRLIIDSAGFFDVTATGNDIARFSGANSGGLTIRNDSANQVIIHTATSDDLVFGTGGNNDRVTIDASGDVGIGTTVPAYTLDILNSTTPQLNISNTASDDTAKFSQITTAHYHNSEEPMTMMEGRSDGSNNYVRLGGGRSEGNAMQILEWYFGSNDATTGGTKLNSFDDSTALFLQPLISGSSTSTGSFGNVRICLLYTSPSPRDRTRSRMPSSA